MPQCTRCQNDVAPDAERCPRCGAWLSPLDDAHELNAASLVDAIRLFLSQGQTIAAIKLYRERTGLGLAAAKDAVERIGRGEGRPDTEVVADDLERQILELLAAGKKIAAIKLHREQTGSGLKEAKDAVEASAARHGIVPPARSGCLGVMALLLSGVSLFVVGWLSWPGR